MMLRATAVAIGAALVVSGGAAGGGGAPDASASVVAVTASGCSLVDARGVGWVGPGSVVVTAAHVVRGAGAVAVDGAPARVVRMDLRTDVAVLSAAVSRPPLRIASGAAPASVWIANPRQPAVAASARRVTASIDEPGGSTTYTRQALALDEGVDRGESGSPVVDRDGSVVGMVFARTRDGQGAFAVASSEIAADLAAVSNSSPAVDTERCA